MPALGSCPHPKARLSEQPYMDGKWIVCALCGRRLRQTAPPKTRAAAEAEEEERREAAGVVGVD